MQNVRVLTNKYIAKHIDFEMSVNMSLYGVRTNKNIPDDPY